MNLVEFSLKFGGLVAYALLSAEPLIAQQQKCMAALDSGTDRSDLAFTVVRKSDRLRADVTVIVPATSVSIVKTGERSKVLLTWAIVQRDRSGKRFGESWKGEIHLNMLLPESLERFRQDGVKINQRLVSSDDANLQIMICDTYSGNFGTQTIRAYEHSSHQ